MPWKTTLERAERDKEEGKAPSTQAGEFVREEMEHVRRGKHGARNTKQAIAIGLSKARRAGVKLGAPKSGTTSAKVRKQAQRDLAKGQSGARSSRKRSMARERALKHEPHTSASHSALSKQAKQAAGRRSAASRSAAAKKAAQTKGAAGRHRAAEKAAHTRQRKAA
jgi:hypothetical protein